MTESVIVEPVAALSAEAVEFVPGEVQAAEVQAEEVQADLRAEASRQLDMKKIMAAPAAAQSVEVGGGAAGAFVSPEADGPVTDKDGWTSVMGGDAGV
jgi:hypothetical protein